MKTTTTSGAENAAMHVMAGREALGIGPHANAAMIIKAADNVIRQNLEQNCVSHPVDIGGTRHAAYRINVGPVDEAGNRATAAIGIRTHDRTEECNARGTTDPQRDALLALPLETFGRSEIARQEKLVTELARVASYEVDRTTGQPVPVMHLTGAARAAAERELVSLEKAIKINALTAAQAHALQTEHKAARRMVLQNDMSAAAKRAEEIVRDERIERLARIQADGLRKSSQFG